jgi:hypothetical protein
MFHVREVLSSIVVIVTLISLIALAQLIAQDNLTNPGTFLKGITPIFHVRGVKHRRLSK